MLLFAHVSDMHFGDVLANGLPGTTRHQDPHLLSFCQTLRASLGNEAASFGLPPGSRMPVVCSGDLTLAGSEDEFAVGHAYLRDQVRISRQAPWDTFGLAVADDQLASVPGNHDHWNGMGGARNYAKGVPTFNANLADTHFRPTPWTKTWADPGSDLTLQLFGVDSSSGWAGRRFNYFQAGSISQEEFKGLERLLGMPPPSRGPRAIVCHHSPSHQGWWPGMSRLDAASTRQLLDLAQRFRVNAVLTGHTHDFHFAKLPRPAVDCWELRSASTVAGQQAMNGYLLHALKPRQGGGWTWECWRCFHNGIGFERAIPQAAVFTGV